VSLRWRLSIALALAVAVGALVFGVAARATVERVLYDDVDRELQAEMRRFAGPGAMRGMDGPGPRRGGGGPMGELADRRPGAVFGRSAVFAQIVDEEGRVVLRTSAIDAIGGLPEPRVDADSRGEAQVRTIRIDGERYRLAEVAVADGVVQVARPLDELAGYLDTLRWVLAAAGATALGAALLLGPWVARTTLRPVERMTATTRSIAGSPRDLTRRVEPAFPDRELREFADAMNEMLDSIAAADQHQRRFVADASHELRTPLTSLGGNASYLARSVTLDDDAREALDAVGRDIERLIRIADGMTMLARLDATPVTQREPCDVDELAADAVARFRKLYPLQRFELEGSIGVELLDVELVRRILDNLLDNAGRYGPDATAVHVTLGRTSGTDADEDLVTIDVHDDGPGLDADERARVVERFHRGTTAAGSSGTGLGLAIVDEAARALGGSLTLEAVEPHGLRCRVTMRSTAGTAG